MKKLQIEVSEEIEDVEAKLLIDPADGNPEIQVKYTFDGKEYTAIFCPFKLITQED